MASIILPWHSLSCYLIAWLLNSYLVSATAELFQTASSPSIQTFLTQNISNTCPVSQDGTTFDTFPWTHNPTCMLANDVRPAQHQDFCVYTNALFASGRGISIITTPEIAASLTAESFASYEKEPDGPLLYQERVTKGRGIGLFATQDIAAGATLMSKRPILLIAREALNTPSRSRRQSLLETAVEQLPEKTKAMFMRLAKSRGGPAINDIIGTNSKGMRVRDGTGHLGVVPEAARVNHACRSNAFYRYDDRTLTLDVFSLRDIKAGEEITFSYGYSTQPHKLRQEMLRENWGFSCTCPLCTASAATIATSDARLARISELQQMLPVSANDLPTLLGFLPNVIELMDEEDLVIDKAGFEEILAYAYSSLSNEKRARHWGERAKKGWEIIAGRQSWEVKRLKGFLGNMQGHGSWGSWKEGP